MSVYMIKDKAELGKFKFLFSAVSTDRTRPHILYAHYDAEKSRLEAVDGKRVHIWHLDAKTDRTLLSWLGKDSCLLDRRQDIVFKVPDNPNTPFPDIDTALRLDSLYDKFYDPVIFSANDFDHDVSLWLAKSCLPINIRFLRDLTDTNWCVSRNPDYPSGPVRFADELTGNFHAYVMPIVMEWPS